MTDRSAPPVHIRHDPNGEGPICYELTYPSQRGVAEEHAAKGYDVHPANGCAFTSLSGPG